jgi:murein DD-endopeptidase MepM/ murein hydrolase activator NlpD
MLALLASATLFQWLISPPFTAAQGEQPSPSVLSIPIQPPPERPFQLPFNVPPGPTTWLLGQPYGNTINAYYQRNTIYRASGGIHFGTDFAAPCGTELVAIGDGTVFAVDGPFGAPPHNLMIDHPQAGYASMYGHLLEMPRLVPDQQVKQGEVIALVGEATGNCNSYPHLHLEIRDLGHLHKYNPALFINANWDNLSLMGSS